MTNHFKHLRNIAVSIFLCFSLVGMEVAPTVHLTLEQAKLIAAEHNAALRAQKEQTAASQARIGRVQASFYPVFETKLGVDQKIAGDYEQASNFGFLLGRWNLFRGGADTAKERGANLELQLAKVEYEQQRLVVESEVELVFSNLLFYRDVSKIKERFINLNAKLRELAKQVAARGNASESDIYEFDLRDATLRSELVLLKQDYLGSLVRLKFLLGEGITKDPVPVGELPHMHFQGSLAEYATPQLSDSATIKASSLNFEIANQRLTASRSRWSPQLDLESKFGVLPVSEGGVRGKLGSSVAFVATWEIFGGFDASHESKERAAEKASADWQLKSDINTLLADIEARFAELVAIQKRTDMGKDTVRAVERYYDLVFADFKRGYKNSADLSAAAQAWYEAEVQRKRLDLDFIEKKLALELKIGHPLATTPMQDTHDKARKNQDEN